MLTIETILSQDPYKCKDKVQRLNGSGHCQRQCLRYSPVPPERVFLLSKYSFHTMYCVYEIGIAMILRANA